MQTAGWIIIALYVAVQVAELCLSALNIRHLRQYGDVVPKGFEGIVDAALLGRTSAYTAERAVLSVAESAAGTTIVAGVLLSGLLDAYNNWIACLPLHGVLRGVLFFLLLDYARTLLSLPFDLYRTFGIERRYGFNTTPPRLWATDLMKTLMLSTTLMLLVLGAGLSIIELSPGLWWLFVWAFVFALGIFMMYLAPYVIEPLFHKFTPLPPGGLEEKIRGMLTKAGIGVSRIFSVDASRRSTHTNAYFTGIGRVKRIVLFDTLLRSLDEREIIGVLAHEAGHWKKRHILKRIALFELASLGALWIAWRLVQGDAVAAAFGIGVATIYVKLALVGLCGGVAAFVLTPLSSWYSRRHEYEADSFATGLSGDPTALASALIKLSRDNLSNLHPHPLYAAVYYTHPPMAERVRSLLQSDVHAA